MRRRLLAVLSVGAMVAALAAGVAPASGASAAAPRYRNLDPGGPARLSEKVPVNLVFVGYEPGPVTPTPHTEAVARTVAWFKKYDGSE